MSDEFILPNWHVVFVHYPLALLTAGVLIELLAFLWRRSGIRIAARWMILLGALASIPVTTTGIYALIDSASPSVPPDQNWQDLAKEVPWNQAQWQTLRWHVWLSSLGSAVSVLCAITWLAASDRWRSLLHLPLLLVLTVSVGLLCSGAWNGGEAVYKHRIAVAPPAASEAEHSDGHAEHEHDESESTLARYVSPLQAHVFAAGLALAVALAATGLTIRRWTQPPVARVVGWLETAQQPAPASNETASRPSLETPMPPMEEPPPQPSAQTGVFPARFWLLSMLLAIVAAGMGLWYSEGNFQFEQLRQLLADAMTTAGREAFTPTQDRLLIHVILGANIVILPLILAALTRFARRLRWITLAAMLLLLAAIGVQLWIGITLMYDFK